MAALAYIAKLKKSLGLAFDAYFLHDFSIKMFLIQYSIYGQGFYVIILSFSRYQIKCNIKLLLRQLMTP